MLLYGKTGFDVSWLNNWVQLVLNFSKWWFWYFSTIICL
jgi:hypothetical protein